MPALYNYKIWNPNLNQFAAQPDMLTADQIDARGGIIILGDGHSMSPKAGWEDLVPVPMPPVYETAATR